MKKFARTLLLVCSCVAAVGTAMGAAPKPDKYSKELKYLFPAAAAFSPPSGNPLRYTAYGADPAKALLPEFR